MEIEKKFLIKKMPENLESFVHSEIEQAYLCAEPVIRVRKKDKDYILTYKSKGMMVRQEEEFQLTAEAYQHLLKKADGRVITKTRYFIPYDKWTIELDVFHGEMAPLVMAEVEFETEVEIAGFIPPDWFGKEVTFDPGYHNVNMALGGNENE